MFWFNTAHMSGLTRTTLVVKTLLCRGMVIRIIATRILPSVGNLTKFDNYGGDTDAARLRPLEKGQTTSGKHVMSRQSTNCFVFSLAERVVGVCQQEHTMLPKTSLPFKRFSPSPHRACCLGGMATNAARGGAGLDTSKGDRSRGRQVTHRAGRGGGERT